MTTFIIEVLVGAENRSLKLREYGGGVTGIDPTPLEPLVGRENSRQIGVAILSNLTMGEVECEGETVGWLAWTATYVEGSSISDDIESETVAALTDGFIVGRA